MEDLKRRASSAPCVAPRPRPIQFLPPFLPPRETRLDPGAPSPGTESPGTECPIHRAPLCSILAQHAGASSMTPALDGAHTTALRPARCFTYNGAAMRPRVAILKAATLATVVISMFFALRQPAATAAPDGPGQEGIEFFEKKIRPVLSDNCYPCHSAQAEKPMSGLRLDTPEGMLKGGASGQPAVMPGHPEKSRLITAIHYTDPALRMPPGGKLTDQQLKDFEAWIAMGAPDPRKSGETESARANSQAAARPPYDFEERRKFWSFQPVRQVAV